MTDHDHPHDPDAPEIRAEALESLLVEKGLLDPAEVDAVIARYNDRVGPLAGARVVARAWTDPDYRARLLADGTAAAEELDIRGGPGGQMEKLVVVENGPEVHNVVVCTLCSCYPWALLGLPPRWYKDPAYRSRVVREPRSVLAEFGLELDPDIRIRVRDSSAEVRYMVLPERPEGTEHLDEDALAGLVHRDAMIGVARVRDPQA
ncbi:MAG: nitrile hydratase subunit alpha [Gammaproteobacteria bacterium]|nr:nitrile hydratase subunit alpha [Gammaproteobacteria bacterium]